MRVTRPTICRPRSICAAGLILVAGFAGACSSSGSAQSGSAQSSSAQSSSAQSSSAESSSDLGAVTIHTFAFGPNPLHIKSGTRVKWSNQDQILHTVTAGSRDYDPTDSGKVVAEHKSGEFDTPLDGVGTTFSYTFAKPGAYHYFCSRHPGMEADVDVT